MLGIQIGAFVSFRKQAFIIDSVSKMKRDPSKIKLGDILTACQYSLSKIYNMSINFRAYFYYYYYFLKY